MNHWRECRASTCDMRDSCHGNSRARQLAAGSAQSKEERDQHCNSRTTSKPGPSAHQAGRQRITNPQWLSLSLKKQAKKTCTQRGAKTQTKYGQCTEKNTESPQKNTQEHAKHMKTHNAQNTEEHARYKAHNPHTERSREATTPSSMMGPHAKS